ncbi:MAG: hypothetical protein QNJ68_04070 [Microcoleaceae cyanobacterium MO_207.B10]|nr:hypothetical protein [Microcoleaceae cyanobacterium MO_207.B10]
MEQETLNTILNSIQNLQEEMKDTREKMLELFQLQGNIDGKEKSWQARLDFTIKVLSHLRKISQEVVLSQLIDGNMPHLREAYKDSDLTDSDIVKIEGRNMSSLTVALTKLAEQEVESELKKMMEIKVGENNG